MRHVGLPLMLITMAACGGGNDRPSTVVIDTLPGGVEHVRNTGPSAWPGMEGWRLELEQVIAPEAGAPGELVNPRSIVADTHATYFGAELDDQFLTPGANPRLGPTRFDDWLSQSVSQR